MVIGTHMVGGDGYLVWYEYVGSFSAAVSFALLNGVNQPRWHMKDACTLSMFGGSGSTILSRFLLDMLA